MRRSIILAGVAVATLVCILRRRPRAAADAARAGRRSRMPRRLEHRLHRRLRDQSRLRAARRRHAGGPLCRDHPQGRRRSRHHPGIGAGLGRVRAGGAARAGRSLGQLRRRAGQRVDRRRGSAATCWSAAPTIRSRCSRSACRARSASTSRPGWKAWNFGREGNSRLARIFGTEREAMLWDGAAVRGSFTAGTVPAHRQRNGPSRRVGEAPQRRFSGLPNRRRRGSIVPCRPNHGPSSKQGGGNGTRRQKSPRSTVHCAGGPFPKR